MKINFNKEDKEIMNTNFNKEDEHIMSNNLTLMHSQNLLALTALPNNSDYEVLIDVRYDTKDGSLRVKLSDPYNHLGGVFDLTKYIKFPLSDADSKVKNNAWTEVEELFYALNIEFPKKLIKAQLDDDSKIVICARLLKKSSWDGWALARRPQKLRVIREIDSLYFPEYFNGCDKDDYHHYCFAPTNKFVTREQAIVTNHVGCGWSLEDTIARMVRPFNYPDDFLVDYAEDGLCRGYRDDYKTLKRAIRLNGPGFDRMFYRIKFDYMDVVFVDLRQLGMDAWKKQQGELHD